MQESRPEIGGSFGGFVGLVVGLSAIFLLSCIGIFILLRNHEPTPHERHIRRTRTRGRDKFTHEAPIGPPGIRERFAHLFGRRTGWIKASGGDGDEWDAAEDPIPYSNNELRERDHHADRDYPASMASTVGQAHANVAPSASTDSVEVELRAPSGSAPLNASLSPDSRPRGDGESDGADRAQASSSVPLRESPPSMLPSEGSGTDGDWQYNAPDERKFSVQTTSSTTGSISIRSMRKFDNGTKFKEGLTFE